MNLLKHLIIIVLFTASKTLISGNNKTAKDSTVYYLDLSHKLLVSTGVNSTFSNLTISKKGDKELSIKPLGQISLTAGFNYKWLGLELGIGLPSNQLDIDRKGNTSKLDLQLNVYSKKIGADFFFQHYTGFHIDNPKSFSSWSSDTLPQLPKMEQYAVGATAFYIFNHKRFSYCAPYVGNAKQIKSAGSLLAGAFFNLDAAGSDGGFVPYDSLLITARDSFPIFAYSSASYGISFGYSYTLVIAKNFFLNVTLMPGIGEKQIKMETYNLDSGVVRTKTVATTKGFASRVMFRTALGYERKDFLIGVSFYSSQGTIAIKNFEFTPGLGSFRFFIAKRFGSNKNSDKTIEHNKTNK